MRRMLLPHRLLEGDTPPVDEASTKVVYPHPADDTTQGLVNGIGNNSAARCEITTEQSRVHLRNIIKRKLNNSSDMRDGGLHVSAFRLCTSTFFLLYFSHQLLIVIIPVANKTAVGDVWWFNNDMHSQTELGAGVPQDADETSFHLGWTGHLRIAQV